MKRLIIFIVLIAIIYGVWVMWKEYNAPISSTSISSPLNATYVIDGKGIAMVDGKSEIEIAPDSATKITTTIFGEPVYADLDNDGDEDSAMFITQDLGGSGIFYYVAVALNENGEHIGTNAIFLGDRIAPQNINISKEQSDDLYSVVIANYADRKPDEPMTTQPSIGISKYLIIKDGKLQEMEK